jgi:hypothetical protein
MSRTQRGRIGVQNLKRKRMKRVAVTIGLVVLVSGVWLVTDRAEAESYTWDGSYTLLQYWDEPTNWSPQGVPSVKGDTVTFDSPGLFPPSFSPNFLLGFSRKS